jgi:D-3-phosphoglycerate dehydrogenase / 2-oxoglutarate reductase
LSFALLMALARKLPQALKHVTQGGWTREEFPGVMLRGKTLGLIGCGRIGGWMARYARAFDMDVIGYDPFLTTFPDTIRKATQAEVFAQSDFVSIHVHLSPETTGLVTKALIDSMKPGAFLINTSRGAIVDESALLAALESGRLGGAGLDVLEGEPDTADHPLVRYARTHDNLLITPHVGGFSPDAVRVVCAHAAGKIRAAFEGAK